MVFKRESSESFPSIFCWISVHQNWVSPIMNELIFETVGLQVQFDVQSEKAMAERRTQ